MAPAKPTVYTADDLLSAVVFSLHQNPQRHCAGCDGAKTETCLMVADGASISQKHAAVLGLKAFVLTSPYDVPSWLPEVLMALVRAAGQPAPIKTTVRYIHICT